MMVTSVKIYQTTKQTLVLPNRAKTYSRHGLKTQNPLTLNMISQQGRSNHHISPVAQNYPCGMLQYACHSGWIERHTLCNHADPCPKFWT